METLVAILDSPGFLMAWAALAALSAGIVLVDLRRSNAHLMPLMKLVWVLTTLYSGPIGLAIYWRTGRRQIPDDALWRRGFRSVAHCYSGCGMGETLGILLSTSVLGLATLGTSALSFALAYAFGFALTVGPLVQGGEKLGAALKDAVIAETPSITVMELVALGVGLTLNRGAEIHEPIYWSAIVVSLSCGLIAAWPVNLLLIRYGVKEGMMDPRMTDHGHGDHGHGGHGGHGHGDHGDGDHGHGDHGHDRDARARHA